MLGFEYAATAMPSDGADTDHRLMTVSSSTRRGGPAVERLAAIPLRLSPRCTPSEPRLLS
jgi:hypothetical protein